MRRLLPLALLFAAACSATAPRVPFSAAATGNAIERRAVAAAEDSERHGFVHTLLFYIPNRIFDVFDIARAQARLGPGFGIGAQLTRLIGAHADWYTTVWLG